MVNIIEDEAPVVNINEEQIRSFASNVDRAIGFCGSRANGQPRSMVLGQGVHNEARYFFNQVISYAIDRSDLRQDYLQSRRLDKMRMSSALAGVLVEKGFHYERLDEVNSTRRIKESVLYKLRERPSRAQEGVDRARANAERIAREEAGELNDTQLSNLNAAIDRFPLPLDEESRERARTLTLKTLQENSSNPVD